VEPVGTEGFAATVTPFLGGNLAASEFAVERRKFERGNDEEISGQALGIFGEDFMSLSVKKFNLKFLRR
jgi:hypothetical protein